MSLGKKKIFILQSRLFRSIIFCFGGVLAKNHRKICFYWETQQEPPGWLCSSMFKSKSIRLRLAKVFRHWWRKMPAKKTTQKSKIKTTRNDSSCHKKFMKENASGARNDELLAFESGLRQGTTREETSSINMNMRFYVIDLQTSFSLACNVFLSSFDSWA